MKTLLSDNSKFISLNTDKNKSLNYRVNLEKKLKEHFKTLENNKKKLFKSLKVLALLAHTLVFCMDFLKFGKLW